MIDAMDTPKRQNPLTWAAPLALSLGLFYSAFFAAPLAMFSPAPLYYAITMRGPGAGMAVIGAGAATAYLIGGLAHGAMFLAYCGAVAWVLAESRSRNLPLGFSVGLAGSAPFAILAAFMLSLEISGANPGGAIILTMREAMDTVNESYKSDAIDPEFARWLEENTSALVAFLSKIFLGAAFAFSLVTAFLNYAIIRAFSLRYGWGIHAAGHDLTRWRSPNRLVWALIAGGFAAMILPGTAGAAGLNTVIVCGAVYMLHGLSALSFFLARTPMPVFLKALVYFIIFSQPVLIFALGAFGLADVWADFRKITGGRQDAAGKE